MIIHIKVFVFFLGAFGMIKIGSIFTNLKKNARKITIITEMFYSLEDK